MQFQNIPIAYQYPLRGSPVRDSLSRCHFDGNPPYGRFVFPVRLHPQTWLVLWAIRSLPIYLPAEVVRHIYGKFLDGALYDWHREQLTHFIQSIRWSNVTFYMRVTFPNVPLLTYPDLGNFDHVRQFLYANFDDLFAHEFADLFIFNTEHFLPFNLKVDDASHLFRLIDRFHVFRFLWRVPGCCYENVALVAVMWTGFEQFIKSGPDWYTSLSQILLSQI